MRVTTFVDDQEELAGLLASLAVIGVFTWYNTGGLTLLSQLVTLGVTLAGGAVAWIVARGAIHRVRRWRA